MKTFTIKEYSTGDFGDLGRVIGTIKAETKEQARKLFQQLKKISDSEMVYYDIY